MTDRQTISISFKFKIEVVSFRLADLNLTSAHSKGQLRVLPFEYASGEVNHTNDTNSQPTVFITFLDIAIQYAYSILNKLAHINENNSRAGIVRVDANLPGTSTVIAQFLLQMHNKNVFDQEKNEGQSDDGVQHLQRCHWMANIKL